MKAVSITNKGGRENNEDCIRYAHKGSLWCFVLCDGLGGHNLGEVASELVARTVCDEFKKNPALSKEILREYIEKAARLVSKKREEDISGYDMATTVVALVTNGRQAVWANIGDSRLYYIRQGEIAATTNDHSIAYLEYENGLISYNDIRYSPNQNRLLRCIGDFQMFNPDISDIIDLNKGDAFLLCSDGFWELVNEENMTDTLKESKSPKAWIEKMLDILHENKGPYNDNYSVVAATV